MKTLISFLHSLELRILQFCHIMIALVKIIACRITILLCTVYSSGSTIHGKNLAEANLTNHGAFVKIFFNIH